MNQTEIRRKQILIVVYMPVILALIWFLSKFEGNGSGYFLINLQICLFPLGGFMIFFPQVAEKLIRSRMSKGQYKNANRVWKCVLVYGIFVVLLSTLVLFLLSGFLAEHLLGIPNSLYGLRLFIPAVCFLGFLFVIRGYFQGMGSGMPTVISAIVFYICATILGYNLKEKLKDYGVKTANLLQNRDFEAMYANVGVSIGITLASICALMLLVVLLLISKKSNNKYMREGMRTTEDYPYLIRVIGLSMLPYMVVGFCLMIPPLADVLFLKNALGGSLTFVSSYSTLVEERFLYLVLLSMPVLPGVVELAGRYVYFIRKEEFKHGRDCMHASFIWIFLTAAVLSLALCTLGGEKYQFTGILIFLVAMAFLLGLILWKLGRVLEMSVIFICGAVCHLAVSGISLYMTGGDEINILYGYMSQAFLMIVLCGFVLFRNYAMGLSFVRTLLMPILAVAISGVAMLLLGKVLLGASAAPGMFVLITVIGGIINLILLVLFRSFRAKDLYMFPCGKVVVFLGKRLHVLK